MEITAAARLRLPVRLAVTGALVLGAAASLASSPADAQADSPTSVVVRNVGSGPARIQVAFGVTQPCDSPENRLVFDAVLEPGVSRAFQAGDEIQACARSTSAGSTLDWGPSRIVRGAVRCRTRKGPCWHDGSVPIMVEVRP